MDLACTGIKQEMWGQPLAGSPVGKWQPPKCLARVGLMAYVWPVSRAETQENNNKGSQVPKLGPKVGHNLRKKV